jgi:hypothetical protein
VEPIRVLSSASNYAVVQMPGRRFPGMVVQGDRLREWTRLAHAGDYESIAILANELSTSLEEYDRVSGGNASGA